MKIALLLALSVFFLASQAAADDATPDKPRVALDTSMGKIVLVLHPDKTPKTVENFLAYVRSGHYDGTIFHRVIPNFMNQGGGFTPDMRPKPTREPIENEAAGGLKNNRGTIAMARTQDPHSAGAQFFINTANNDFLNHSGKTLQGWGYAVFGEVVEGMDVVDKIAGVKTGTFGMFSDVPVEPVLINKALVE